jgi:hypothetical protein
MDDALQARALALRAGPIFVVPALCASIAIAGCSAKSEKLECPVGWMAQSDGCHDGLGNVFVNGGYLHDDKKVSGWHIIRPAPKFRTHVDKGYTTPDPIALLSKPGASHLHTCIGRECDSDTRPEDGDAKQDSTRE